MYEQCITNCTTCTFVCMCMWWFVHGVVTMCAILCPHLYGMEKQQSSACCSQVHTYLHTLRTNRSQVILSSVAAHTDKPQYFLSKTSSGLISSSLHSLHASIACTVPHSYHIWIWQCILSVDDCSALGPNSTSCSSEHKCRQCSAPKGRHWMGGQWGTSLQLDGHYLRQCIKGGGH